MDSTIPAIFSECVNKYGDLVALRRKHLGVWQDISWDEYYREVSDLAAGMVSLGLEKGDRIAIIGDNCTEWVMIEMAALCVGAICAGVYATNSWDQCEYVVNHSEAKFYFMENEEQLDKWLEFKENAPHLEKVFLWDLKGLREFTDPMMMKLDELFQIGRQALTENPDLVSSRIAAVKPDDQAMFIYTSGTTGRPKGAILTQRNLTWIGESISMAEPEIMKSDPRTDPNDIMSYLPLCHIYEQIYSVLAHIRHGYTVNFIENLDTIADNMREISPTVGHAVPRIWEKYHSLVVIKMSDATWLKRMLFKRAMVTGKKYITKIQNNETIPGTLAIWYRILSIAVFRKLKERLGFERLRIAFSGAAPISPEVLTFFNIIGVNLREGYGQTEGTGVTTVNRLGQFKVGTVGIPIEGVEIKIADDGEILVKSPGVFQGYYKDPEQTADALQDGWLQTGDTGEIDSDGFLKITGRKKDIIITAGGKNITPQYIEGKIVFSPYVNDAIVIGDARKYLTALIVLDEENTMKYAQDNKIQFSTYRDLTTQDEIKSLIQREIDTANKDLSRVEQIKRFTILPYKLYQEEGDVTPTMKVKRKYIKVKYKELIDNMY